MSFPSHEFARELVESHGEVKEEGVNYVAMRNLFTRETSAAMEVKVEKKTRKMHVRESADRLTFGKKVSLDLDS